MSTTLGNLVYACTVDFFDHRWHQFGEVYWFPRGDGWDLVKETQSLARMRRSTSGNWNIDWLAGSGPGAGRVGMRSTKTIAEVQEYLEDRVLSELERFTLRLWDDTFDPESVG